VPRSHPPTPVPATAVDSQKSRTCRACANASTAPDASTSNVSSATVRAATDVRTPRLARTLDAYDPMGQRGAQGECGGRGERDREGGRDGRRSGGPRGPQGGRPSAERARRYATTAVSANSRAVRPRREARGRGAGRVRCGGGRRRGRPPSAGRTAATVPVPKAGDRDQRPDAGAELAEAGEHVVQAGAHIGVGGGVGAGLLEAGARLQRGDGGLQTVQVMGVQRGSGRGPTASTARFRGRAQEGWGASWASSRAPSQYFGWSGVADHQGRGAQQRLGRQ